MLHRTVASSSRFVNCAPSSAFAAGFSSSAKLASSFSAPEQHPLYALHRDHQRRAFFSFFQSLWPGSDSPDSMSSFPYVVVGGGTAGGYAIRALVEAGVEGKDICMIGSEPKMPYERPALTKAYLHAPGSKVRARLPGFHTCVGGGGERQTPEWYVEKGITVHLSTHVKALDAGGKKVTVSSGQEIEASKGLFVATGASARMFDMYKGTNVSVVRNEADCAGLVEAMEKGTGLNLVIVGGGYIGLEVAAAAVGWKDNLASVTVLNMDSALLQRIFADAPAFSEMLEASLVNSENGVKAVVKNGVKFKNVVRDDSGKVTAIELEDGSSYPSDLVVLGLGAAPATGFMEKEFLTDRGFVTVDSSFSFAPGCYAFGDCCQFPLAGADTVLEHVGHARASAKHAVLAALGKSSDAYALVPFFYSRMYEYSEKPLIWNMWGTKTADAKVELTKKDNGLIAAWKDGSGKCVSSCIMMQGPAPTQEELDATKGLMGA